MKATSFAALALLLTGCGVALTLDPTGYACSEPADCPTGYSCIAGLCQSQASKCAGVVCTPSAPTCADSSTARQFTSACDPATGDCVETSVDLSCAMGCADGLCAGDLCAGVVCNAPPAAACLSASTLRTFVSTGTCGADGKCTYPPTDTACPSGCANGACTGDPCAGKVCEAKPPVCVGSALRTFAAGVCNAGTGACDYAPTDTACPGGCAAGACTTPALTFAQVLPRLDFAINAIDQAPGSGASTVLAVGNAGVMAWWNGATWTKVPSTTTRTLNAVWFATGSRAYVAGDNKTLLRVTFGAGMPQVATVNLTGGSGGARLVAVHGVGDPLGGALERVAVASDTGEVWRLLGVITPVIGQKTFSGNSPYAMNSVFVNNAGLRVGGSCNGKPCVANWAVSSNTLFEDVDNGSTGTFSALGPIFGLGDFAFAGRDGALRRHGQSSPYFDDIGAPTLTGYGPITGITPIEGVAATRGLYLLGSSALARANSSTSVESVFDLYNERQRLSPNESTGVLVTDTRSTLNVNDVVRRTALGAPALDLGEDWAAVNSLGPLTVLTGAAGDVAWRVGNQTTWEFRRGPAVELRDGVATAFGAAGAGAVLVGAQYSTGSPTLSPGLRLEAPNTLVKLTSPSLLALNAVCRVSDTEFYAVGEDGDIATLGGGTAFTTMSSPTTRVLYGVDCQANGAVRAVACGSGGTLLRLQAGAWSAVPNTPFTTAQALTSCRFGPGGSLYVAGDNLFARFDGATWTSLPDQPKLRKLVVLAPNDVYALSAANAVVHFNGSSWSTVYTSPTDLSGAGQQNGRIQAAGKAGQLAESR